jgi:predicted RNase H-like nuclease (RuvC/YqgF family)
MSQQEEPQKQKNLRSQHKIRNDAQKRQRTIERLRREAKAKMLHVDALQAEADHLIRTGKLLIEEETLP